MLTSHSARSLSSLYEHDLALHFHLYFHSHYPPHWQPVAAPAAASADSLAVVSTSAHIIVVSPVPPDLSHSSTAHRPQHSSHFVRSLVAVGAGERI